MLVIRPPSLGGEATASPSSSEERRGVAVRTYVCGRLLSAHHVRAGQKRRSSFLVGSGRRSHAPLPATGFMPDHELVRVAPGGAFVWPAAGMDAAVVSDHGRTPLPTSDEDERALALPEGVALELRCGDVRFEIEPDVVVPVVPRGRPRFSRREVRAFLTAIGLVLPTVLIALFAVPPSRAVVFEEMVRSHRFLPALVVPAVTPVGGFVGRDRDRDQGLGKSGPSEKRVSRSAPPKAGPAVRPRAHRRVQAQTVAELIDDPRGLIGLLRASRTVREVLADSAVGDEAAIVALTAVPLDGGKGIGFYVPGTGADGAGVNGETGFDGTLATIGKGGGCAGCGGGGYGRSPGHLEPRTPHRSLVTPVVGEVAVKGALDKEIVRREIRRHLNEVRHCYERALPGNPDLGGRLVVRFLIGPDGIVRASSIEPGATLSDPGVGACVAQAVRRWQFPAPKGGGMVDARYPFLFSVAGGR